MSEIRKVLVGPKDTDFGIARLVVLPDGSGRGEIFDEGKRSWVPSTNPKLTVGELSDALPVSPALAKRLGIADSHESEASSLERRAELSRRAIESKYTDYASAVVRRLSKRVTGVTAIGALGADSRTSGDDSGLQDVWEEFKAQVQGEESVFFGAYKHTILTICEDVVGSLAPEERMLLWLESDASYRWWEEEGGEPDHAIIRQDLSEELYGRVWKRAADEERAGAQIADHDEGYAEDEPEDEFDN